MVRTLNLEKLSKEDTKELFSFLKLQSFLGIKTWIKGKTYRFIDDGPFKFPNYIVCRKRNPGKKGYRFELVGDKLIGEGGYGTVFDIQATLALENQSIRYKPSGYKEKSRVIKMQIHSEMNPKEQCLEEYRLSQKIGYLHVKKPVFFENKSYTVMRQIKGRELFDIIEDDFNEKRKLRVNQRIKITQALSNCLQYVHEAGIVHRDIKPENILVDINRLDKAYLIDFGLSRLRISDDKRNPGTPGYASPEVYLGRRQNEKSDVFSMGRVIALLWGIDTETYFSEDSRVLRRGSFDVDLSTLFSRVKGVSQENKSIIRHTLEAMLHNKINKRICINEVVKRFSLLSIQKKTKKKNVYDQGSKKYLDSLISISGLSTKAISEKVYEENQKKLNDILLDIDLVNKMSRNINQHKYFKEYKKINILLNKLRNILRQLTQLPKEEYNKKCLDVFKDCLNKSHEKGISIFKDIDEFMFRIFKRIKEVQQMTLHSPEFQDMGRLNKGYRKTKKTNRLENKGQLNEEGSNFLKKT